MSTQLDERPGPYARRVQTYVDSGIEQGLHYVWCNLAGVQRTNEIILEGVEAAGGELFQTWRNRNSGRFISTYLFPAAVNNLAEVPDIANDAYDHSNPMNWSAGAGCCGERKFDHIKRIEPRNDLLAWLNNFDRESEAVAVPYSEAVNPDDEATPKSVVYRVVVQKNLLTRFLSGWGRTRSQQGVTVMPNNPGAKGRVVSLPLVFDVNLNSRFGYQLED